MATSGINKSALRSDCTISSNEPQEEDVKLSDARGRGINELKLLEDYVKRLGWHADVGRRYSPSPLACIRLLRDAVIESPSATPWAVAVAQHALALCFLAALEMGDTSGWPRTGSA